MATTGMLDIRKETIDSAVKGFALQEYTMMDLVSVSPSSAWKESYFQETAADITTDSTFPVRGVPRFAPFPNAQVNWTKKSSYNEKYGMSDVISYEDELTNEVDVVARTLLRIARGVTKIVDTQIWNVLTENQTPSTINSLAIAAGSEWNSATVSNQNPIQDVLNAIRNISIDNYNPLNGNGYLVLSPTDYASILGNANIRNAGQFYTADVTKNGNVGRLAGLTMKVSNVVTADYAAVVIAKTCGVWKQVTPLTTDMVTEAGIKKTISAYQYGVCQLLNPEAVCLISNTQA